MNDEDRGAAVLKFGRELFAAMPARRSDMVIEWVESFPEEEQAWAAGQVVVLLLEVIRVTAEMSAAEDIVAAALDELELGE